MSVESQKTDPTPSLLDQYLKTFGEFVDQQSIDVKDQLNYKWAWAYDGGHSSFQVVVTVMIHGNEVGPLEGLLDIMDALQSGKLSYSGKFLCVIGNPEAAQSNQRFIDKDLNRVFEDGLSEQQLHEVQRAQEIMPLLQRADLYIDFHQTILDSMQPFYICPFNQESWYWMRVMGGAKVWVTRHPQRGGGGLKCADEYVRQRGKASIALELGALGFSAKARAGVWKSLSRAFSAINRLETEGQELKHFAENEPDLQFYETDYRCQFTDPRMKLREGLINFQAISEHEVLSNLEADPMIHAPKEGYILFPKYPNRDQEGLACSPRPKELYRIITPLAEHPLELWPDLKAE